jgi:molybdenum cofactor guanylyltransferase
MLLEGKPMAGHVADCLRPQVDQLLLSCNRNQSSYRTICPDIAVDLRPGYQGPLAGIEAASAMVSGDITVIVACDTPHLPIDTVARLLATLASEQLDACIAFDGQRQQYLCAAVRSAQLSRLPGLLDSGERAVRMWYRTMRCGQADFSDQPQAFKNYNRGIEDPDS